ncbi:DUF6531 domain-containing protein [Pseudomonas saxonica]|nr:DUF6531 domain-containing protein [Pseudomonas saxonica]WRQ75750.1 DUF6531 domain-containing protein [Pseudomonas saxonica]
MTDSIQPDVPTLLLQHRNCLANYRQLSTKWYGGMLAAEQKFSAGDSAITRSIESKRAVTRYALCKKDGTLTLIHAFESAHFVPIGNTPVRLTPVAATSSRSKLISRDYQDHVRAVENYGEDINTFIDDSGIKLLEGCKPDQRYRVTFYPQTTPQQIDAYFDSYQGLLNELGAWLSQQWNSEFQPLWRAYDNATNAEQLLLHAQSALKGFGDTLIGLWDSLVKLFDLITHPKKNFEKLAEFLNPTQLDDLINASAQSLQALYLVASDEPLLWAYFSTFQAWLQLLPPLLCTEMVTRLTSEVLIDILIGVVLTGGLGLAVKYTAKAVKTITVTAKATDLLDSFIDLLLRTSKARATQHAHISKPILLHADAPLNTGTKGKVDITPQPGDGPDQSLLDTTLMVRGKPQTYTEIVQVQHVDDVPAQSKNLNDQPAEPADKTCTQGCPVSMVTGEELLTLTDTVLDGVLPFEWTRLYRTSAVESQSSLGFGWSHSLNHRLQEDGDELLWTDHENRQTRFPRPTAQRPAITNSLARAAIYLGEKDGELILAQAGATRRFYHFQDFKLIAISDAYGNRLTITHRDGRLHRIEDKFERALMLRYHNNRLCAVDYQYYDHSREFIERSDEHYAKYRVRLERWTHPAHPRLLQLQRRRPTDRRRQRPARNRALPLRRRPRHPGTATGRWRDVLLGVATPRQTGALHPPLEQLRADARPL